ncbi:hypothetical protein QLG09_16985 [Enterobacter sp. V89_11]|uniref:tail fiber/spike domain-containing protein n=1 Tax=Enterobacter sp. V89_11 TaxID=3044237 RepID=UPI00249DBAC1|nr:hypothetical protein [Enterobacter sp. V89_11]MDI3450540.1 hypothetical protein [Enterobacter sp. V89_11]
MATTPTNLPVPSESPIDLKFNAGKIDEYVTSMGWTYTDRFGQKHYTIEGNNYLARQAISAFGYITLDSFEDGNTLTLPNQVLRLEASGEYYRWDGAFPSEGKIVPPLSTPNSTGGIGPRAWLSVGDAVLRNELASDFGDPLVSSHKVKVTPHGNLAEIQYYVTPEQFGNYVDENTDFTTSVQAAINYAAANSGVHVRGTNKVYGVGAVIVTVGCKKIESLKLKCVTPGTDTMLRSFVDTGHDGLVIRGCDINANSNASKGITVSGIINSTIEENNVYGFASGVERYGIRIGLLSATSVNYNNKIINNTITMPIDPDNGSGSITLTGIGLVAIVTSNYGGIDINGGTPLYPSTITLRDTLVSGNVVSGGTHGLQGGGIFRANISNNTFSGQSHRSINLSSNCQRVQVNNNFLLEAGSSGVNVAWGCRWIDITDNYIQSSSSAAVSTDDAAIQCYKGITTVNISNNMVLGDWKYSLYLGAAVSFINVTGNSFNAGSLASICIESDWAGSPKPTSAIYSRAYDPNTVPVAGASNEININANSHSGTGCVYALGGFNSKALTGLSISNEVVGNATSRPHILYSFDTGSFISEVNFINIKARGASASKYFSTGNRSNFSAISNVTLLEDASGNEVSVTSSTPSVWIGPDILVNAAVSVTNFTGGANGQIIRVRLITGAGITHGTATIRLKGGVNITSTSGDSIVTLEMRSGVWFEISRNF